jgi:hypothetical protein
MYEPPARLTPAEIGALIDDRLDPRDVTATLIDLAVRGYIRIEETHPDAGVSFHGQDYLLRLLKPRQEWHGLAAHETAMLFHTFYGGHWTKLSSLRLRFYPAIAGIRHGVFAELTRKGMYRVDPDKAQALRQLLLWAVAGLVLIANAAGLFRAFQWDLPAALVIALSAAIVYLFGRNMTAKTALGMRTYIAIRGFQEFLETVEADRLERSPAALFEQYLPYAMALGVEHRWAQAFRGIATSPEWFEIPAAEALDAFLFSRKVDLLSREALATFTSAPRWRRAHASAPAAPAAKPSS